MKGMTGAHSSSANPQHGLTDRLARWAKGLSGKGDDPHAEEAHRPRAGAASNREITRRRQLYTDIGDFLFAHDLDLTPINFSVALDYLTGANIGVEKAIRAVMMERGRITNGWMESLAADQRAITLVFRMNGNAGISEHGLGSGGRNRDEASVFSVDRVLEVPKLTFDINLLHLKV